MNNISLRLHWNLSTYAHSGFVPPAGLNRCPKARNSVFGLVTRGHGVRRTYRTSNATPQPDVQRDALTKPLLPRLTKDLPLSQCRPTMAMTKTSSGLSFEDTQVGTGASPNRGQTCVMHYTGWLWQNGAKGSKFDSSLDRGRPFSFQLGRRDGHQGLGRGRCHDAARR